MERPDDGPEAATVKAQQAASVAPADGASDALGAAYRKMVAGDVAGAIADAAAVTVAEPTNRDALSLLSTLYEQSGDIAAAIATRERLVEIAPDSAVDRERLATLRAVSAVGAARRPRSVVTVLSESPAAVAVAVMLVVLLIGAGVVWAGANRAPRPVSAPPRPTVPPAMTYEGQPTPRVVVNPGVAVTPPQPNAGARQGGLGPGASPPRSDTDYAAMRPNNIAPAPVTPGSGPALEADPRYRAQSDADGSETVHLRDGNAGEASARAPSESAPDRAPPPPRDPGRIEIILATPGGSSVAKNAPPRDSRSPGQSSDTRRAYAQQQQLLGNYREAISAYRQALDGAGDSAPAIHQQIALCHEHLNDRRSAASSYNEMAAVCKAQIAAGRNVETAKQALKAAELSLKALR